ncbi:hypothetical protein [Arthrobacter sp. 2MCAF14]|uniref:hypothetical protein n=1 Tax=Arthrobacter sp. 2MCAF14 TaxID=3232982 RepID=UPI003F9147EA
MHFVLNCRGNQRIDFGLEIQEQVNIPVGDAHRSHSLVDSAALIPGQSLVVKRMPIPRLLAVWSAFAASRRAGELSGLTSGISSKPSF